MTMHRHASAIKGRYVKQLSCHINWTYAAEMEVQASAICSDDVISYVSS